MLFNSYEFILFFLPTVFVVYFLLNKYKLLLWGKLWLIASSLFFYGWWNVAYLPLLIFSFSMNFLFGKLIEKRNSAKARRYWLIFGILCNVLILGYFKYTDFLAQTLNNIFAAQFPILQIILPLAISFHTFQQISFLVETYKNEIKERSLLNYALFVSFFPQLIAGPIVRHHEMMPQFESNRNKIVNYKNIATGLFLFSIGLFKKVLIADKFATWATSGFDHTTSLTFFEAWIVSLSYTLQLYFDFSGYTDMALGIALLFNIKLPINFYSPYKALDIQEFWRRWHMTLGQFLTKYVYIPLGGNRHGAGRTYIHLLATFTLSGLWHGAGWTFVFWGVLHGLAMVINRTWKALHFKIPAFASWLLTFLFVNITWVFFRATEWSDAIKVLKGMFGLSGVWLPPPLYSKLYFLHNLGIRFVDTPSIMGITQAVIMISILMLIVLFTRNSIQLKDAFKPTFVNSLFVAFMFLFALGVMYVSRGHSEFIYFNF